jgi:hypothetical protein
MVSKPFPSLAPFPGRQYQLILGNGPHVFCGENSIPGAECPNCKAPLLHIATLDQSDPNMSSFGLDLPSLPLLTCWTCPASTRLHYRIEADCVTVLEAENREPYPELPHEEFPYQSFPHENYPRCFPASPFHLEPIESPSDWWGEDDEVLLIHTIGGYRTIFQDEEPRKCLLCGTDMKLFAVICDLNTSPLGFTNNIGCLMLLFICADCGTITATQQCD